MHRRRRHQRSDAHALGDRGDGRQHAPDLVHVAARGFGGAGVVHVVVGQPDAVPARGIGLLGQLEHFGRRAAEVRPERDLHAANPRTPADEDGQRDVRAASARLDRLPDIPSRPGAEPLLRALLITILTLAVSFAVGATRASASTMPDPWTATGATATT